MCNAFSNGNGFDRQLIHAIESVIIDWSHQIRDVLKRDSSQPLLDGLNPTPRTEVDFWKGRAENLECIYDQLRNSKVCMGGAAIHVYDLITSRSSSVLQVRKMAELLEKTNSSYYPSFKTIFHDVVQALTEAQDINLYLKPLSTHFEDLEQVLYYPSPFISIIFIPLI